MYFTKFFIHTLTVAVLTSAHYLQKNAHILHTQDYIPKRQHMELVASVETKHLYEMRESRRAFEREAAERELSKVRASRLG